jgi:hypothetical protein
MVQVKKIVLAFLIYLGFVATLAAQTTEKKEPILYQVY